MSAAVAGSAAPSTIAWRGTPTLSPKRMKSSGCDTLQPEMRPVRPDGRGAVIGADAVTGIVAERG